MPTLPSRSPVTQVATLPPAEALQHFSRLLELETDCWDVHASLEAGGVRPLDVRSPELFRLGHLQGAVNLPDPRVGPRALDDVPAETPVLGSRAGPHFHCSR